MTSSRSLPEAVRGCWYFVEKGAELARGLEGGYQIYSLGVDGSFVRYQVKGGRRKTAGTGDYTFDGNFLILRGRQTETYRVKREAFWRWGLEGTRKDYYLLRAMVEEGALPRMEEEDLRNLRILPLRAEIREDFKGEDNIYRAVYLRESGEEVLLGTFFVEKHPEEKHWVGVTPLVEGIEVGTWERIIKDSFLDMFKGKPEEVGVVTVRLLDTEESRVFNYKLK